MERDHWKYSMQMIYSAVISEVISTIQSKIKDPDQPIQTALLIRNFTTVVAAHYSYTHETLFMQCTVIQSIQIYTFSL